MILTYSDIMSYGFRIGADIRQETVELAIDTAEKYIVFPSLEGDGYDTLANLPADSVLVVGGEYVYPDGKKAAVAGLKKGIAHIAFAELLRMNIAATTFGSVQKEDDYSTNVDPKEQIRYFLAVGTQYVRQVCDILGMKMQAVTGVNKETYFGRRKEDGWR